MALLLLEQFPKVNKYIKTQLQKFRKPNSNLPKRELTQAQNAALVGLVKKLTEAPPFNRQTQSV